jgi:hypothetical protein
MSGPTPKTRQMVIKRDQSTCQWCGCHVDTSSGWYSLQHRRSRGMGGTKQAWVNGPANLVLMCGTGTTRCHGHVEAHPIEAAGRGFRLGIGEHPDLTPIEDWSGFRWRLEVDGSRTALEVAR